MTTRPRLSLAAVASNGASNVTKRPRWSRNLFASMGGLFALSLLTIRFQILGDYLPTSQPSSEAIYEFLESVGLNTLFGQNGTSCGTTATWLASERFSNDHTWGDFKDILDPLAGGALNRTICHPDSVFRQFPNDSSEQSWVFRLLYLGIHLHQHRHARNEALLRKAGCNLTLDTDFQCQTAKFFVSSLPTMGLGATARMGLVPMLLTGLYTDRVVVFMSNLQSSKIHKRVEDLARPWPLAGSSCPRRDYQCFFRALTPCVLSKNDLEDAYPLPWGDVNKLKRGGHPFHYKHEHRVLLARNEPVYGGAHPDMEFIIRKRIYTLVQDYLDEYPNYRTVIPPNALQRILTHPGPENVTRGSYFRAGSLLHQAALFYTLRPNHKLQQQMEEQLNRILPTPMVNPVGLPIRASDKCRKESTCLPFPDHVELATSLFVSNTSGHILLTSESPKIMRQRFQFSKSPDFNYTFVVNDQDSQQDTGLPKRYGKRAEQIMVSSLVAIQLQLQAQVLAGNCCSSFHITILEFLRNGCGPNPNPDYMCLQETKDPKYHLCCEWSKEKHCVARTRKFKRKRIKFLQNRKKKRQAASNTTQAR